MIHFQNFASYWITYNFMPMKHILIILSLFTSLNLYAQDTLKYEDLLPKNKIELTQIYLNEVVILLCILPATSLDPSDIPSSNYLAKQFRAISRSSDRNTKVILKRYRSIIAYSDKEYLISSIMFLNEMKLQANSIK